MSQWWVWANVKVADNMFFPLFPAPTGFKFSIFTDQTPILLGQIDMLFPSNPTNVLVKSTLNHPTKIGFTHWKPCKRWHWRGFPHNRRYHPWKNPDHKDSDWYPEERKILSALHLSAVFTLSAATVGIHIPTMGMTKIPTLNTAGGPRTPRTAPLLPPWPVPKRWPPPEP